MSIPNGGGYPAGPPNVPGPPGSWQTPPPGGPLPPGMPPGGPPSGSWPPSGGYPYGPPPPPGGGRRNAIIAAVIGAVVVIAGIIVAVVLITQGDDDSGKVADPTESATGTASKSSSASPSASSSTSPSTSPSNSPTTRRPTASAPDPRTVLANLNVDDCIDMPAAAFVTEPIHPVSCSGPDARWRIVDIFQGTDVNACGTLPPDRAAVGHLQEFTANGRVACLGFTRNTTLEDLKGLAGSAAANMTQQQFDDLRQGFVDRGYRLE